MILLQSAWPRSLYVLDHGIGLLSLQFSLSISWVEVNLGCKVQSGLLWVHCILWYVLYIFNWSLLQSVNCNIFTPALQMFLVTLLTVVLGGFFSTVLTVTVISCCFYWLTSLVRQMFLFHGHCCVIGYAQCPPMPALRFVDSGVVPGSPHVCVTVWFILSVILL